MTGPLISAILVAILLQLLVGYNIGVMVRKAKGGRGGGGQDTKHDEVERNISSFHVHSVLYFLLVRIIWGGGGGRGFIIIIQGSLFSEGTVDAV